MNEPYEEIIEGKRYIRFAPSVLHESVCARLYDRISACLSNKSPVKLLPIRSPIKFKLDTIIRPDITLITLKGSKIWLIAEVIDSADHKIDTGIKKSIYEEMKPPRLWIIDPRYDNVEIYHQTPYGIALQHIYSNKEKLTDISLSGFELVVYELFEKLQ
ncbi:MAG: Uma2 family endonuclease [Verrucomicrobiia bacterium]